MKKFLIILSLTALYLTGSFAQLVLNTDGVLTLKKKVSKTATDFRLGEYVHPEHPGYDNGEWGIEVLADGDLNFWKPWPSPFGGGDRNNYLRFKTSGNMGIGVDPSYRLDVNGDIATYGALRIASDERLKSNIATLSTFKPIDNIYRLNAKSYIKALPNVESSDSVKAAKGIPLDEESVQLKKAPSYEYGFIAQELKEIFPELVSQDSNGYYSINYIGLIPVIVEALKDQNTKIETQQTEIDVLKKLVATLIQGEDNLPRLRSSEAQTTESTSLQTTAAATCRLEQNTPNPFNMSTNIKYYLPETIVSAYLCIYDMQGKQLKQITLAQRGDGSELISASQLTPGMYLYALVADGQEVDVKRMILTE